MASPRTTDECSPKRQAVRRASSPIVALDTNIWISIIEFLPVRTDSVEKTVEEGAATLQTLLNLRLVSEELAKLLHPTKSAALWQKLVLLTFDFSTTGQSWNVENDLDEQQVLWDPQHPWNREGIDEAANTTPSTDISADPQLVAIQGRRRLMPPNLLDEDFFLWDKLGIYHRPSQYSFLTTLQEDPSTGLWPSNEDPFSLFHDLLHLLQLPDGESMGTGGEGGDTVHKCLVPPVSNSDPSSPFYSHHVMQTLGYAPHFWTTGCGIGKAWKGFTEPNSFAKAVEQQEQQQRQQQRRRQYAITDKDTFENDDGYGFPTCTVGQAKQLYKCISQSYSDWRSVCCNSGCDGETPVFYVGKRKAQPHRWVGYGGNKVWT